ncbi:NUDIX domain-containing protein [Pseudomonas sp. GV047]|uniref:NUDIX domain-containing protein n=1 Tax=Pseudomonas sp. GV047 TaxID=2135751 RepID=UPI000D36134A|nr:NUDIX domain-containing protein [Pseudomonas sp. GV047]
MIPKPAKIKRTKQRATVIYHRGEEVLLVRKRKANSKWNLPGGRLDQNETAIEAAFREMAEETGLELAHLAYIAEFKDTHIIHHLFESSASLVVEPRPCNEIEECRWFTLKELDEQEVTGVVEALIDGVRNGRKGYSVVVGSAAYTVDPVSTDSMCGLVSWFREIAMTW